jgi:thymidylate synthase (FAD)
MKEIEKIQVELQEWMGSDRQIANSAWTSSYTQAKKDQRTDLDVERVITQMAKEGHGTPFESVVFRFWIKLPTSNDRQHMTHRHQSPNGMSARYRTLPDEWYSVPDDVFEIMNRFGVLGDIPKGAPMGFVVRAEFDEICRRAFDLYNHTLKYFKEMKTAGQVTDAEYKRIRETMRNVLPIGNMIERSFLMNLRSFANYQRQRNEPHAQLEIQRVAQEMLRQVEEAGICPIAIRELQLNGWRI